jgi:hypothetical protein
MARSLWWITCSCTCLVGRAHGVDQKLGPSCWNQALVIVMENKTWEAEAFEPLISCPFWPPVLHLRASMIKFLCSNSPKWNIIVIIYYIRWWPATWDVTNSSNWGRWLERINDFVSIIITQAKNKEIREWKKEIQTFLQRNNSDQESRRLLLLSFCFVNSNWFRLSLIRFSSVPNSASFSPVFWPFNDAV